MEKLKEGGEGSGTGTSKEICVPEDEAKEDKKKEFQERRNPLDIPEIVAIVTGHISEVGDLKSIRTQSKAWRDETLLKWRSSAVFLITDETIPILVKAFGETDLADSSEEEKAEALTEKDPFRLHEVPFRNYRFARMRGEQPWTYPLDKNDIEGNVIWEKVINLHASYLDVGECALKKNFIQRGGPLERYLPGLKWILKHCNNVTDLAMAPLMSNDLFLEPNEQKEILGPSSVLQNKGQSLIYRSFIPSWMTHRLALLGDSFPKITSFVISTPKTMSERPYLKPLVEGSEGQGYPVGQFIIGAMINLIHLTLPNGGGGTSLMNGLRASQNCRQIKLESLTAFAFQRTHYLDPEVLSGFSLMSNSPLRQLCLSVSSKSFMNNFDFTTGIYHVLTRIKPVLVKLELEVDCEVEEEVSCSSRPSENADRLELSLRGCTFPKLTHFKVTLDYDTFPGRLGTVDLNYLKRMPKIQEFYFGMKKVEKDWVTRKLEFVDDGEVMLGELTDLKSFHFHGNFTKESLRRLGGLLGHLNTLEVVLDEENFQIVGKMWPRLKKLKLLEGSDVPVELLSNLKMANPSLEYE